MRIAVDATALYGRYGGVEYSLWNLLSAMHAEGTQENEYCVYVPQDGPPPERLQMFGARWRWVRLTFRGEQKLRRIFWQQRQLPGQLRRDGCQLLHSPTYIAPLNVSVPVVLTVYDLIALTQPRFATRLNRAHYGTMLPLSIARAARVLVPSLAVEEEVQRRFAAARTRVVPLGVEPIFFREKNSADMVALRQRYKLPPEYLLFVGNFEPKKNLTNLLRAIELLPDAPPLVIAGGNRAWPDQLVPPSSHTQLLGYVPRADLPALYGGCEAFVFPSLAEGFGLPVLEALACGAPTVTSNAVPLPQLQEVAVICDPADPTSIAAGVRRVLEDKAQAERFRQAGPAYAQPFTWRQTAQKTLHAYRESVSSS